MVGDWRLEVHGAGGQDPGAAEFLHDLPLCEDVLAGVVGSQERPESESSGFIEVGRAKHGAPAQPCDPVGQPFTGFESEFGAEMSQIGSVVQRPPVKGRGARAYSFRLDGPLLGLEGRGFLWSPVRELGQSLGCHPDMIMAV